MPSSNNDTVLSKSEKLRLRLQAARSTSIPESAYELWARSEKRGHS